MKIAVFGAGFLGSWISISILPIVDQLVLVDMEPLERENYENGVFIKDQIGRSKSLALATTLSLLSNKTIHTVRKRVDRFEDLDKIYNEFSFDLGILTFDNVRSRLLVREWALKRDVPIIWAGVTRDYALITWADRVNIDKEDIETIEGRMRQVRDVCTRLEFRPLGVLVAGAVLMTLMKYMNNGTKADHVITTNPLTATEVVP